VLADRHLEQRPLDQFVPGLCRGRPDDTPGGGRRESIHHPDDTPGQPFRIK